MNAKSNWRLYVLVSLVVLAIVTAVALVTRVWVLTAIPIGFLFGFFLQKGDLCGSSSFSELLLMKDWRKMWGLWVCIVVGMLGFALLDLLGWVTLNPKPFIWLSAIVGGIIFGVGMVLAGGCVSGCLYKTGMGNLNSMAGLVGIPLGIAMVEHGPLHGLHTKMKSVVIRASDGGSITLSSITGLPYWLLAVVFGVITLLVALAVKKRRNVASEGWSWERALTRSWKPWQAGLAIGLLAMPAYLSSAATGRNYPLGVTHGVLHAQLLVTDHNLNHVWQKQVPVNPNPAAQTPRPPAGKKVVWWLILLVTSLVIGSWVSGRLSGETRLLPKPPEQTVVAFFGGILVGTGAAFATGCVIGNILSGWALMSIGMFLFGIVTILTNWVTTYLYFMGGSVWSR